MKNHENNKMEEIGLVTPTLSPLWYLLTRWPSQPSLFHIPIGSADMGRETVYPQPVLLIDQDLHGHPKQVEDF